MKRSLTIGLRALALVALLALAPGAAAAGAAALAATSSEAAGRDVDVDLSELSPQEREALLAQLTDAEVRALLLRSWQKEQATEQTVASATLSGDLGVFRERFSVLLASFPRLPEFFSSLMRVLVPPSMSGGQVTIMLLCVVLVFVFGYAIERLYSRFTGPLHQRIASIQTRSFSARLGLRIGNLLVKVLGIAIAAVCSVGALLALHPGEEPLRLAVLVLIGATAGFRTYRAIAVFLFKPIFSDPRLIPLGDDDADRIYRLSLWVGVFWAFVFSLSGGIYVPLVPDYEQLELILARVYGFSTGFVFHLMAIAFVWMVRRPIADLLLSFSPSSDIGAWLLNALAQIWHVLATIVMVSIYVAALYTGLVTGRSTGPIALTTLGIVIAFPLLGIAVQRIIGDYFAARARRKKIAEQDQIDHAAEHAPGDGDEPEPASGSGLALMASRISWLLLTIVVVATIGTLWGVDIVSFADDGVGSKVIYAVFNILVAVVLANVAWVLISRAMEPYLPDESEGDTGPSEEIGGTGASRISTLMPLFRKFLLIALVVVTLMVVLSSLGVDIGPLIAGAGVIGLAIGFGAQTLVRDIISGVFFLMDDAFRKGEYISIGDIRGTVERISIRSFQLRHHNGPVHTVPYGEITSLTNYSRDWVIMKFEIRVPFETDVDKVRKLIKKLGQEMMEDEEIAPLMLEPLKSQGVNRMDDSAMIVRCKFTAKPGQQFILRRHAFTRIQRLFEEQGLHFAPKRVVVETTSPPRTPAEHEAIAAAAAAAVASEQEAPPRAADDRG